MRWFPATVFVLAVGCGAGAGVGGAPSQQAVFAASGVDDGGEQHPVVAAAPVLAVLRGGSTNITVRGTVSRAHARSIARTASRTYRDFNRRFRVPRRLARERPVDVVVFDNPADYRRTARAIFNQEPFFAVGFYMASHRLVLVDVSRGLGNLRHEMIHPLLKDWFPNVPAWLDEGIASLYGSATYRGRRYAFLVNYRLRHLRHALWRGTAPTINELARSTYEDVHGPEERAYYAMSRYLMMYLERRGMLSTFVRGLRDAKPTPALQRASLQRMVNYRAFLRWTRRLRY